ncbi:MAG: glutamine amidotransferase-related protein, partial [Flavobacteriales bacterium]
QCAVIEYARNVLNMTDANSTEMNCKTKYPVIDIMENQHKVENKGGTMRLGSYNCTLNKNSNSYNAYQNIKIQERHRHRYEFNNSYLNDFNNSGMNCVGENPENKLIEIVEIPSHPWFVGVQFHPEYRSTVLKPHPLFSGFIDACIKNK